MSTNNEEQQATAQQQESENSCVVCFKPTLIFSIGSCNHPVCYECSARMRCLCLQNECPICRQDLPKVIFTKSIDLFSSLDRNIRSGLFEKKFKILFADLDIQKAFYHLLENRCPKCDEHKPFADFNKLKEHVRKVHESFYCEICTENLKIFSNERRCYSRSELATHRRVGDPDNKSHRGHPRCDYCELRYLDKDELYRHLRREHYFCHLCDADGKNLYFGTTQEMRTHFKAEHFLCEEQECIEEEFTAVFRSEIDLKAHRATVHSRGMSKAEMRQARTLEIEFSYGSRGRAGDGGGGGGGGGQRNEHHEGRSHGRRNYTRDTQREFDSREIPNQEIIQQPPIKIDASSEEQFPSLAGPSGPTMGQVQLANSIRHSVFGTSGLAKTKENFPSLGGLGAQTKQQASSSSSGKQQSASSLFKAPKQSKAASNNQQQQAAQKNVSKASDYPSLPQSSSTSKLFSSSYTPVTTSQKSSVSTPTKALPKTSDFPSLSQQSSKSKTNKNERLMEDMIESAGSGIEKGLISSKRRNLVNEYVSMAAQVTKVQLVKQKEELPSETFQQSVPKLNSSNNFPTLGGGGGSASNGQGGGNLPQWLTVKATNNNQKKVNAEKSVIKVPQSKPQNGMKKAKEQPKKEKPKANKENESATVQPPPGFKKADVITYSKYTPLPDAVKRNQALLEDFEKILETHDKMQEFKLLSSMFRNGNYFARSYYESCKGVLGEKFDSVFPELIALLPDIEKQQKLYRIHLEETNNADNPGGTAGKKKKFTLDVCSTCQQVVLNKDLNHHIKSHQKSKDITSFKNQSEVTTAKN